MKKALFPALLAISVLAATLAAEPSIKPAIKATASSFERDQFRPDLVLDSNPSTRWSSDFSDPQWLLLDLGLAEDVCGITINWEAAYARIYDVMLSRDNINWKTVYSVKEGDGGTDEIYFPKQKAAYIKIFGKERATSWGYSILDVKVKWGADEPALKASSSAKDSAAQKALDGMMDTFWKSGAEKESWITADLKTSRQIGGFELFWGGNFAREYEIYGSADGKDWKKLFSAAKGNGGRDLIYTDKSAVRHIKITMKNGGGSGFELREIALKGPDESATPQKTFELAAMESKEGYYPRWLSKQQVYWTVTGVDGDPDETLFSEDGAVEPFFHSFSLQPFLHIGGELISSGQCEVSQELEKGYLPIPSVTWKSAGFTFKQTIFSMGENGKSGSYLRYKLENKSAAALKGKLFLAVRPFQVNPPWQYGGLAEIRKIGYEASYYPTVYVNDRAAVVSFGTKPYGFGAQKTSDGEVVETLRSGSLPQDTSISDSEKYASGALGYDFDVPPGKTREFYFYVPIHKESVHSIEQGENDYRFIFDDLQSACAKMWDDRLASVKINIPEQEIISSMRTHLAYILINRDLALLQPGARNYNRSWMRDCAIISAAMLRTGFTQESREFVDFMVTMQGADGFVPFMVEVNKIPDWAKSWTEYDSQGEFVYSIMEYYRFTNDKKRAKDYLPAAKKAMEFIVKLRNTRLTDEYKNGPDDKKKFYGLVPPSNSHEGYFPAVHSYWDDFFTLKGWKDLAELAAAAGDRKTQKWAEEQGADFRKTFYDSMRLVMRLKNLDTVPASADYADFDPTSTSIGLFPCGEYEYIPHPQMENTFEKYYRETFLPKTGPGWKGGYTPYEQRNAMSFLIMGQQDKVLNMVRYFVSASRPRAWNELAEVVFANYRQAQYIGDMPHTWISGEFVNTIRSLFVFENKDSLELSKGVDGGWYRSAEGVSVADMPTYWGMMGYSAKQEGSLLKVSVTGKCKPPKGFAFVLPQGAKAVSVKLNGKDLKEIPQGKIMFDKLPAEIQVVLENK